MESLGRWLLVTAAVLQLSGMLNQSLAQQCNNKSLDFPSGVHNSPREVLRGDLQLLIPGWRLNETGFISLWQAVVTTIAPSQSIEFQLYRENGSVYELVYGNEFDTSLLGHMQDGDRVDVPIDRNTAPPEIPIFPGYVVGIRLNGTDPTFGLQCTTAGQGVDLYSWRGMGGQACTLSLSDPSAELVSGIVPLVSWTFCPRSSLRVQELIFDQYIEDFPRICSDSLPDPTPSVSSTATSELQRSSQATPSAGLVIATSATQLATSPNPVTTGPPPSNSKGYNTSPTTIITLAIMIFLTILTLVLIVVVIILLRNALRKRNQVSKVIEAIPPPPPARKPVPVNESRQLQTEPVTVIEEDTRPVHEVLI